MFQFHNGSIKSGLLNESNTVIAMFQFHNGSIKSEFNTARNKDKVPRFNSTMVRLKEGDLCIVPRAIIEFQFHNGSIKRNRPTGQQEYES